MAKEEIARFDQLLLLSLCFQKAVCCRGVRKRLYEGRVYSLPMITYNRQKGIKQLNELITDPPFNALTFSFVCVCDVYQCNKIENDCNQWFIGNF